MFRLTMMMFTMIGTTLAGTAVMIALLQKWDSLEQIGIAAGIGAVIALPLSYLVAQRIMGPKA
ncbi:MAG: CTP synthetase [Neomegalonema sp.]|nr:CTP synthetase [Neomegalonema sp.]